MPFYAVRTGETPGIYTSWDECKNQIQGYSNAQYKKFQTYEDACGYMGIDIENKNVINKTTTSITENIEGKLYAYVDGSYNAINDTVGYGVVLVMNDTPIIKDLGAFRGINFNESKNVFGEIRGSLKAVELAIANGYKDICIVYDYLGIEMWATNKWRAKKDLTQDYQSFIQKYMRIINISFLKVKAHSGQSKWNDVADSLANLAAKL